MNLTSEIIGWFMHYGDWLELVRNWWDWHMQTPEKVSSLSCGKVLFFSERVDSISFDFFSNFWYVAQLLKTINQLHFSPALKSILFESKGPGLGCWGKDQLMVTNSGCDGRWPGIQPQLWSWLVRRSWAILIDLSVPWFLYM